LGGGVTPIREVGGLKEVPARSCGFRCADDAQIPYVHCQFFHCIIVETRSFLGPISLAQRLQADHVHTVMEREEQAAVAAERERLGLAAKRPGGSKNKSLPLPLALETSASNAQKVGVT